MMRLRIATYNIHRCVGRNGVENIDKIAAVLKEINADAVALQEVTSNRKASADMLAELALATAMPSIDGFTLDTSGTRYGNAILTRLPISQINRINISVAGKEPRGVIEVDLTVSVKTDQTITLWATHLGLGIFERRIQFAKLLQIIETQKSNVGILLGDFNEWLTWGRSMRALQRIFSKAPSPSTFPAWKPFLKLDRILITPSGRLVSLRRHATALAKTASDHLPLIADIEI